MAACLGVGATDSAWVYGLITLTRSRYNYFQSRHSSCADHGKQSKWETQHFVTPKIDQKHNYVQIFNHFWDWFL